MAPLQRRSIIIIDDDDGSFTVSDEISNISHSSKRSLGSLPTKLFNRPTTLISPSCRATNEMGQLCASITKFNRSLQKNSSTIASLPSAPLNLETSKSTAMKTPTVSISSASSPLTEVSSIVRLGSARPSQSLLSLHSPNLQLSKSGSMEVITHNLIELREDPWSRPVGTKSPSGLLQDKTVSNLSLLERTRSLCSLSGTVATEPGQLIDLDEVEEEEDIWDDEQLQFLRIEDISLGDGTKRNQEAATKPGWLLRNPPVMQPLMKIETVYHMKFLLRPKKTVEISDGDFLHITDIIRNTLSGEVTLRGIRYQRCNALNGMLERKLNEICLFYEIDIDDPRTPSEQSAIEVPVEKVNFLRHIRRTNLSFPLGRNFAAEQFRSSEEIAAEGGLTARWKYTCKYHSANDRYNNRWLERSLETFSEQECTNGYGVSNAERRFQWRGETIMGGSHVPSLMEGNWTGSNRGRRHISISSENSNSVLHGFSGLPNLPKISAVCRHSQGHSIATSAKRERSPDIILVKSSATTENPSKKLCTENRFDAESIKQNSSSLQIYDTNLGRFQPVIDLESESCYSNQANPDLRCSVSYPLLTHSNSALSDILHHPPRTSICSGINVWSSELATPPPTGIMHHRTQSVNGPVIRFPGQMLTFGDGFCGAGGTTRGAVMAGLKVKWGFDFWENACKTWETNFKDAACYCMPSDKFVRMAQSSSGGEDIKVDILHLSPPCQYFSPAHTVNGVDDEMNTASLYAVLEVVKAVRPRVVTLEQTFGILGAKCRWYFSSVIHMFATLRFSVRWAIVPLSTWGLPQRRHRLIIIGACPGEILPTMPSPTHSESGEGGLKPFVTVNETLSKIPPDADHHDPDRLVFADGREMRPWDGNKILPRAMTTSGGQNYHPSGTRDFTLREYACLQGFPINHAFVGSGIKKQIGNAVPPCVAKVLFKSIKRNLDEADGVVAAQDFVLIE